MAGRTLAATVILTLALPTMAGAHSTRAVPTAAKTAAVEEPCRGDAIEPDQVVTGQFGKELQGSYVMVPFQVPAGVTAVRVKYCYDQPTLSGTPGSGHTLDLGLYEPRPVGASATWGVSAFRGWGGSSHPDVTVSREGFSSEAAYQPPGSSEPDPRRVPGKTTRAFLPGTIKPGQWAVELGVASVATETPTEDGKVSWRVEIELSRDPAFANQPYEPADYDESPARSKPGWYAGDTHVHAEHSALGDATMSETFDYAFGSSDQGKAGLDFITLSDYVSGSSWGEVGRFQDRYPESLIIRSAEVITYRGHVNNHNSAKVVDYREGPIHVRRADGTLAQVRGSRDASAIFGQVLGAGGYTQINHPTIFPSPPFPEGLCRGCSWTYRPEETDYSKVHGIEVATGPSGLKAPLSPGPNPFTVTGLNFYEDALARGHKVAAIGSSDSHNAGRTPDPVTQAPIGEATTVVFAKELSATAIQEGVEAGHTYVKVGGNDRPDLRFEAQPPSRLRAHSGGSPAIMGDTIRANAVSFKARVLGAGSVTDPGGAFQLLVIKDGVPIRAVLVTGDDFTTSFNSTGPGRYRLQLQRGTTIEGVTSPIYVETPRPADADRAGRGGPADPVGADPRSAGDRERGDKAQAASGEDAHGAEGAGGDLPFTGLSLALIVFGGATLMSVGTLLGRRVRSGGR
jgi:hypothetical protein